MSYTNNTNAPVSKATQTQSWTNISGTMKVFGKERETEEGNKFIGYSTSVGKKVDEGKYKNCFFNIRFKKENDPKKEGAFQIEIHSGFLTADVYKDKVSPVIVITDFDFI